MASKKGDRGMFLGNASVDGAIVLLLVSLLGVGWTRVGDEPREPAAGKEGRGLDGRRIEKVGETPVKHEWSAEQRASFRMRLPMSSGVLVLYDAAGAGLKESEADALVAYWFDFEADAFFVFPELLTSASDVGQALRNLERDRGVDFEAFKTMETSLGRAIERAGRTPQDEATWQPASLSLVVSLISGEESDAETGAVAGLDSISRDLPASCCPANGFCCIRTLGTEQPQILPPPSTDSIEQLFHDALSLGGCCDGGGGGPESRPCGTDADCSDGSPCTTDWCQQGGCARTTFADGCCNGSLGTSLAAMDEDLAGYVQAEGLSANLEVGVPDTDESGVTVSFFVYDAGVRVRAGSASVGCGAGGTGFVFEASNDNGTGSESRWWTLRADIWFDGDTMHAFGDLEYRDIPAGEGSVSTSEQYQGGWSYSAAGGPWEDPGSDPGFHDQMADMFNLIPSGGEGGLSPGARGADQAAIRSTAEVQAFTFATVLKMISNLVQMGINNVRDRSIAYKAPAYCGGPSSTSSCTNGLPCWNTIPGLSPTTTYLQAACMKIDDLTMVSDEFKQCMKGRCHCGGSYHPRAQITCDTADDCGPCGPAGGCNIGGSQEWYCETTTNNCICVGTVMHEMSHACGAMDQLSHSAALSSYRIGDWFKGQCNLTGGRQP